MRGDRTVRPPLRVGLVGCGRLAEVGYVPALRTAAGVELAAVAEPDHARRTRIARLGGQVPAFPDAATLVHEVGVDGLVLATPVDAHLADAEMAAAAGVAVLVEKPPAADRAEAARLAALTPTPWIAFNRRFEPASQRLRAALPTAADVVLELELRYRRGSWAAHAVADDALLDLGPHLIDLARWITGADVTQVRWASVTPHAAAFELALERGVARIRCATNRPHTERITVRHRGAVLGAHRAGGFLRAIRGRVPGRRAPHPLTASLTAQLEAFARAVRGASEPTLGRAPDGVAVMAVVDAVRTCAADDAPTAIATEEEPC